MAKKNPPFLINQEITLVIEGQESGGKGLARAEGYPIFVEGALPTEEVVARITEVKATYLRAVTLHILKAAKDRITPLCPYDSACGGCQLNHQSYEGERAFKKQKVKDALERIGGFRGIPVEEVLSPGSPYHYRNKSQFPIGSEGGVLISGFYQKGSHTIVDMEGCLIQKEILNHVHHKILTLLKSLKISHYNEHTGEGLLRHLVLRVGVKTEEVMVIFVINGEKLAEEETIVTYIEAELKEVKTVVINQNTDKTNVILGRHNRTLLGDGFITEYLGDLKCKISPLSFFQINTEQAYILYQRAVDMAQVNENHRVMDLYSGTGTITSFLAQYAREAIGVEVVESAVLDARANAKENGIKNTTFIHGAVEDVLPKMAEEGVGVDVLVLDPPRKGSDEKTLQSILTLLPERIVYISCNPATLARDLKILTQKYTIECVQPVDLFPRTEHVECVVLMSKI